tara:strand:- start:526 stop:726 length:201 start_codon:yes stop_codon:yes gene_type:complete
MRDKTYKQLKESLHDLWGEMERGKVSLEQAHETIKALDLFLTNVLAFELAHIHELKRTLQTNKEEK